MERFATFFRNDEHKNLATDPAYMALKTKLSKAIPKRNKMPAAIEDGGNDSYGRRYEMLREQGVPDWLGSMSGAQVAP